MVGISGYIGLNDKNNNDVVERMSNYYIHTGEESVDTWDNDDISISRVYRDNISSEQQPFSNGDNRIILFMTGEIFDYDEQQNELIEKGYEFENENNDAEFCLHSYIEYGKKAFEDLNGSFNLVIYNKKEEALSIVTDRFSTISLYYFEGDNSFIFGNSMSSFTEHPDIPDSLDLKAVWEFFTFQRVFADRTYYENVKMAPPGSILTFSDGSVEIESYYDIVHTYNIDSKEKAVRELANSISNAVERRTSDSLNYGVFLSGGLDSRAILAAFLENNIDVTAFTFAPPRYADADLRVGKEIAAAACVPHQSVSAAEPMLDEDILEEVAEVGDGMHRIDHAPMREYIENINGIDVAFHGLELDYTIGGTFIRSKSFSIFGEQLPLPIMYEPNTDPDSGIKSQLEETPLTDLKSYQLFSNIDIDKHNEYTDETISDVLDEMGNSANDVISAFEYFWAVPAHRVHVHLNDTAASTRVPTRQITYDNELFETYLDTPPKYRYNRKVYQQAINAINPKIAAVENSNTGYPANISRTKAWFYQAKDEIIERIKNISNKNNEIDYTPLGKYIQTTESLQNMILDTINDPECIDPDIFDIDKMEEYYNEHMNGEQDNYEILMSILTFGLWHKKYSP